MTNTTYAVASDYFIWAAIIVLALAMVAFSVHLAVTGSVRERRGERLDSRAAVAVGAGSSPASLGPAGPTATGAPGASAPGLPGPAAPTRRWGVVGLQLTWLA